MTGTSNRPRTARLVRASIAALALASAAGCADDGSNPAAPDVAPRGANGVGEHGGGRPHAIAWGS